MTTTAEEMTPAMRRVAAGSRRRGWCGLFHLPAHDAWILQEERSGGHISVMPTAEAMLRRGWIKPSTDTPSPRRVRYILTAEGRRAYRGSQE